MTTSQSFDAFRRLARLVTFGLAVGLLVPMLYAVQANSVPMFASIVAVALVEAGTALAIGAIIGFLFGIPRSLQDPSTQAPKPESSDLSSATSAGRLRYAGNTSLEQISDWLTKILVGVSLTQLGNIPNGLSSLGSFLGPALGGFSTSSVVAVLIALYFSIGGFFLCYMWTRLYLVGLLTESDTEADRLSRFVDAIASTRRGDRRAADEAIAATVSEVISNVSEELDVKPTTEQREAWVGSALTTAKSELAKRRVVVDLGPVDSTLKGQTFEMAVDQSTTVSDLLNSVYYVIAPFVDPFSYGKQWVLRNVTTGDPYQEIGTTFAHDRLGRDEDDRFLTDVGIDGGAQLAAVRLTRRGRGRR